MVVYPFKRFRLFSLENRTVFNQVSYNKNQGDHSGQSHGKFSEPIKIRSEYSSRRKARENVCERVLVSLLIG